VCVCVCVCVCVYSCAQVCKHMCIHGHTLGALTGLLLLPVWIGVGAPLSMGVGPLDSAISVCGKINGLYEFYIIILCKLQHKQQFQRGYTQPDLGLSESG
jgi:hypothetical protein